MARFCSALLVRFVDALNRDRDLLNSPCPQYLWDMLTQPTDRRFGRIGVDNTCRYQKADLVDGGYSDCAY